MFYILNSGSLIFDNSTAFGNLFPFKHEGGKLTEDCLVPENIFF